MTGGLIFLLIGPSGSGKTLLISKALDELSDLQRYVTHTTRSPRPEETHGADYFFVSRDEFRALQQQKKLIGCQEFYGACYGSSVALLESMVAEGRDGIAAYDVLGAEELVTTYPDHIVTVFVLPQSADKLRDRLLERYGRVTEESRMRLERFDMEMSYAGRFKYLVQNTDLALAVADVQSIIRAERCARRARDYGQPS